MLKQIRKFLHDKMGSVDPLAVVMLAVIMITIIVSVVIFYSVSDAVTLDSVAGNAQLNNTTNSAAQVFNLMNVIPIVAIAGLIISILLGYILFTRQ